MGHLRVRTVTTDPAGREIHHGTACRRGACAVVLGGQEGSGYGLSHARLFSLYRLWKDSSGTDLANASAHLSDSIHGWVHATVPSRDKVAPIGDQSRVSEPVIYDYHRHLMLEARFLSADPQARADAAWWLHHISLRLAPGRFRRHHRL